MRISPVKWTGSIKTCSREKQQHIGKHSMLQKLHKIHHGWQRNRQGPAMPSLGVRPSPEGPHLDPAQFPKLVPVGCLATSGVKYSLGHMYTAISCLWAFINTGPVAHQNAHPCLFLGPNPTHPPGPSKKSPPAGCPRHT